METEHLNILFYSQGQNPRSEALLSALESGARPKNIFSVSSRERLAQLLIRPPDLLAPVVLNLGSARELEEMLGLTSLLHQTRLILILPDNNPKTRKTAHQLRPRYMTGAGEDLSEITEVVERMCCFG